MSNKTVEHVYLVIAGVNHEGENILSAHRSRDGARLAVDGHAKDDGYTLEPYGEGSGYWVCGNGYYEIRKTELKP